jgi:hypothetical protein
MTLIRDIFTLLEVFLEIVGLSTATENDKGSSWKSDPIEYSKTTLGSIPISDRGKERRGIS